MSFLITVAADQVLFHLKIANISTYETFTEINESSPDKLEMLNSDNSYEYIIYWKNIVNIRFV